MRNVRKSLNIDVYIIRGSSNHVSSEKRALTLNVNYISLVEFSVVLIMCWVFKNAHARAFHMRVQLFAISVIIPETALRAQSEIRPGK